jgi:hypothetical protein
MPTYTTNLTSTTTPVPAKHGLETVTVFTEFAVATALVANDIVQLAKVPANAVVTEFSVSCSGSLGTTLTAEFGDGNDTDRYIASATFGQGAASFSRLSAHTGLGATQSVEDTVDMKVNTAAGGTTGATIRCAVQYYIP